MKEGQNSIVKTNNLPPKANLPYEAPYGYFDNLSHRVQQRMQSEPAAGQWGYAPVAWLSAAAVVLLGLGWMWTQWSLEERAAQELSALSQDEISQYLLTHSDAPSLLVMAESEQIDWQLATHWQELNDKELMQWVEEAEILNAMEE